MTDTATPETVNAELVPRMHTGPLSPDQAREAQRTYQEISQALIDPAEDLQTIRTKAGPRTFPKRSALQKLANAYRVSTEILQRHTTYDDDGQLVRCDAIVRATHPDGRYADGDGACSRTEDRFKTGGDKIDHDLPATAVTRATNRAISNLVAFGAVSAEEVTEGTDAGAPAAEVPEWAQPIPQTEVRAFGERLADIVGEQNRDAIGEAIWRQADGIPRIVAHIVTLIAGAVASPTEPTPPAGGWAAGSGLEGSEQQ